MKVRLQYKITFLIFAILLVIGVAGATVMLHFQRKAALSQFEESALTLARVLHDSLVNDMQQANRDHIQDAVQHMASWDVINEIVVLSSSQKIYASGEPAELGQGRNDEEIASVLATGQVLTRSESQYGRSEICVILPIEGQPECYACHDSGDAILGAIEIGLDRQTLDAQVWNQTLIMGLIAGFTFLIVGGALSLTVRSAVIVPLSKLTASARRIGRGDFSTRAHIETGDEVGTVAQAFNEMAERIEQHAAELESAKSDLEQKVDERTKQLQHMANVRGQLLQSLISAQEEERRRIGRELHDEAGQGLTMIVLDLARALDALPEEAAEARRRLADSRHLASQTLAELRKLIYDLRPEVLDQLGLIPALRSYAKSRFESENINARISMQGADKRLPPQIETTLFRVAQEAVTNIVRHAQATSVDMTLAVTGSTVSLAIEDNGKGFDVGKAMKGTESWGLRGIHERIAIVGGQVKIESRPGKTRIFIEVPLDI